MWCYFLYLNGFQCKPLQLRKSYLVSFLVFEWFAVKTVAIKKNLIQYFFCI